MNAPTEVSPEFWGVVEVMGHRRLAGWVSEEVRFGVTMLRVDVPMENGPAVTQYYHPNSLFSVTPTTTEVVKRLNTRVTAETPYQLTMGNFHQEDWR